MTKDTKTEKLFMGFDLSTQQLKVVIIDEDLKLVLEESVGFDKELPQYNTKNGVYIHSDDDEEGTINAPVTMWLEAVDLLFAKILEKQNDPKFFAKIHGVSGSCQQHGSVFWNSSYDYSLRTMDSGKTLKENLESCLSWDLSPNWQDHSTGKECDAFNDLQGIEELSQTTGSRAHFRFTGPQIMKLANKKPQVYRNTSKIQLVSNFLCSVLTGHCTPMEQSDACGANLFDIPERRWNRQYMGLIDSQDDEDDHVLKLLTKLNGEPWPMCGESLPNGLISSYFVEKYGFQPKCEIYPFTGDNLATILSLPLNKNDILVSMGTSTTVLIVTDQYHPSPNYHMFLHPTMENHYMGMICYCNGSLPREVLKDKLDPPTWEHFNEILDSSDKFNNDNEIGVYFPLDEIVPSVKKQTKKYSFDPKTGDLAKPINDDHDTEKDIKNIVESQALSCRVRIAPLLSSGDKNGTNAEFTEKVKFDYDEFALEQYSKIKPNKIFFVGGASQNDSIIKKFAKVMGVGKDVSEIYRLKTTNSCALGGCYKAIWSYKHERLPEACEGDSGEDHTYVSFLNDHFDWEQNVDKLSIDPAEYSASFAHYSKKIKPLSQLEQLLDK